MSSTPDRVLDVGQCSPDHFTISNLLSDHFDVKVDRAATVGEALAMMHRQNYRLVLVNRLIDEDGSDGMELIRNAAADERLRKMPVMLVSNYDDAQNQAIEAGGLRGFGKSQIGNRETIARLAELLPAKSR